MTALRQRQPALKLPKLRQSARGQECTFQIVGTCNHDSSTTVLAHLNFEGGSMGSKTNDTSAAFACSACHEALDQYRISDRDYYKGRALARTVEAWIRQGVLKL